MSRENWTIGKQPALEGVRAVAVLSVFAFHVGKMPGGWLGVEAFFVLSGFLITTLMLSDLREQRFTFGGFYARRAARLLPAITLVVAVVLAYSLLTGFEVRAHVIGAAGSLFYFANWIGAAGHETYLFGHIWSLSIEEQFYLVWPLVLVYVVRRRRSSGVAIVAGVGAAISMALRFVLTGHGDWHDRVYYATDTRAAGLLVGCVAGAMLYRSRGRLSVPGWALWPLAVLVGGALLVMDVDATTTWRVGVTVFDVLAAVLIVGLVNSEAAIPRLLSLKPMVYLGNISYGLYLWHLPVIAIAREHLSGPGMYAVQIAVPFVLAAASYRWVEVPVREAVRSRLRDRQRVGSPG